MQIYNQLDTSHSCVSHMRRIYVTCIFINWFKSVIQHINWCLTLWIITFNETFPLVLARCWYEWELVNVNKLNIRFRKNSLYGYFQTCLRRYWCTGSSSKEVYIIQSMKCDYLRWISFNTTPEWIRKIANYRMCRVRSSTTPESQVVQTYALCRIYLTTFIRSEC